MYANSGIAHPLPVNTRVVFLNNNGRPVQGTIIRVEVVSSATPHVLRNRIYYTVDSQPGEPMLASKIVSLA